MRVDSGKLRKHLILNIPYLVSNLICANLRETWHMMEGVSASEKLLSFFSTLGIAFASPLPGFHMPGLMMGLTCGICFKLAVHLKGENTKKYRHNTEYGSARWGDPNDITPFMDPVFGNNVLLIRIE